MTSSLLLCALAVSAPGPKDAPKKESTIVGEWLIESTVSDGQPERSHPSLRYEFTADGRLIVRRDDEPTAVQYYKVDPKADPPTIDVGEKAHAMVSPGLFKLDGDKLLWCSSWDDKRPKALEAPKGSRQVLVVLRRVKPKD
jgi:uncharacterized protein (TIGR03067 family)